MHHTLGNFLSVELAKLLKKVIVLQQHGTCSPSTSPTSATSTPIATVGGGKEHKLDQRQAILLAPLFPALRENSLLMMGAPVFVVSSLVLNSTAGMQGMFLSLQLLCKEDDFVQQLRLRCSTGKSPKPLQGIGPPAVQIDSPAIC